MILQVTGGEIRLPSDFRFQIKQNHPFYSDEGSSSVPVTVPATAANLALLGSPTDINRARRFNRQHRAILQSGTYFKPCRVIVESGHVLDGIDVALAMDESEAYARIQDTGLRELLANETFKPIMSVQALWEDSARRDAVIFPVAVDADESVVQLINEPDSQMELKTAARNVTMGGEQVSVPAGYGITVFLRLPELIGRIFTLCGYQIAVNEFLTSPQLKDIVLLNNCADALLDTQYTQYGWQVRYRDIVPDVTVGEFITWLKDKFGAFVSVQDNSVSIRLFQSVAAVAADMDLSAYADGADRPKLSYPEPRALVLTTDTGIDSARPVAATLEALRATYSSCSEAGTLEGALGSGLFHVLALGKYYYSRTNVTEHDMIGSDAFEYRRSCGISEVDERKPEDAYVPMILHTTSGLHMPYIGESLRRNMDTGDKDKDSEQKILCCFAVWNSTGGRWGGSTYGYDDQAAAAASGLYPLTPEGLAGKFWKRYEQLIMDGAPEIEVKMILPLDTLLNIKLWTPKLFRGMRVLIKSLEYEISDRSAINATAVLQTLPEYDDAVTAGAIDFSTSLSWRIDIVPADEIRDGDGWSYEVIKSDDLSDYTAADAPSYPPTRAGETALSRERWFRYQELYLDRPTAVRTHYYTERFIAAANNS